MTLPAHLCAALDALGVRVSKLADYLISETHLREDRPELFANPAPKELRHD